MNVQISLREKTHAQKETFINTTLVNAGYNISRIDWWQSGAQDNNTTPDTMWMVEHIHDTSEDATCYNNIDGKFELQYCEDIVGVMVNVETKEMLYLLYNKLNSLNNVDTMKSEEFIRIYL